MIHPAVHKTPHNSMVSKPAKQETEGPQTLVCAQAESPDPNRRTLTGCRAVLHSRKQNPTAAPQARVEGRASEHVEAYKRRCKDLDYTTAVVHKGRAHRTCTFLQVSSQEPYITHLSYSASYAYSNSPQLQCAV